MALTLKPAQLRLLVEIADQGQVQLAADAMAITQPAASRMLAEVERMGLRPREILREVSRKHIFTHIQWNMKGMYLEVAEVSGGFSWFTAEQIDAQAALPTAFRLFWEEKERDV